MTDVETQHVYNQRTGVLTIFDTHVREVINVRSELRDQAVRDAVIRELRIQGYKVESRGHDWNCNAYFDCTCDL